MVDLNQLSVDLMDEFFPPQLPVFPEKTGKIESSGNEQAVDPYSISRLSRFPGPKQETYKTISPIAENTHPGLTKNSRSDARVEVSYFGPGNPGTPGNACRNSSLHFPFLDIETGKREIASCKPIGPDGPSLEPDTPAGWRLSCSLLSPHDPPCPGYRAREWPDVHRGILTFLERYAEAAHSLGWTTLELFGVHPVVGAGRVDCCGALMLPGTRLVSVVERDAIGFAGLVYRRRAASSEQIAAWEFPR